VPGWIRIQVDSQTEIDIKEEKEVKERNKEALIGFLPSGHANAKIPSKRPVSILSTAPPIEHIL
jgi:hypothetical protein